MWLKSWSVSSVVSQLCRKLPLTGNSAAANSVWPNCNHISRKCSVVNSCSGGAGFFSASSSVISSVGDSVTIILDATALPEWSSNFGLSGMATRTRKQFCEPGH